VDTVTITDIKTTKKGRHALFCDAGFLFSVDDMTLYKYKLEIGGVLQSDELESMRRDSDYNKAYVKALDFLALRDHSEKELREKLMRKFDEHTADAAIGKMREMGYLDDGAFAKKYADELVARKGASLREAQNRLWRKGIDRSTIEQAVETYDTDETPRIKELIEKKYAAKLVAENGQVYVYNALLRKGFSSRDIRSALKEYEIDIAEQY
jgi:Uncharacterized protein conserved in bacteria